MNLFQKALYLILSIKEKSLRIRLDKHLRRKAGNSTSKIVMGANYSLSLTAETQKNINLVKLNVSDLVKESGYNADFLVKFIENKGFKVLFIKDIGKLLNLIGEEQGLILERHGLDAFIINIICGNGIGFNSKPIFIFEKGAKDFYLLLFNIFKLEGFLKKLPGYDYQSQKLFKYYYKAPVNADTSHLGFEELNSLKEAIARDNEASEFVIETAKIKDGAKNAMSKLKEGGADV